MSAWTKGYWRRLTRKTSDIRTATDVAMFGTLGCGLLMILALIGASKDIRFAQAAAVFAAGALAFGILVIVGNHLNRGGPRGA